MKYKKIRIALSSISMKLTHYVMYMKVMGSIPNLRYPKSFNEKISWLKFYDLPNNPLAVRVTDKYLVRDYVEQKGYEDILVNLYGSWNSAEDIDFCDLPNEFAMKCNHGCGMNIICSDKRKLDTAEARDKLDEWMKTDWALLSAEPHYGKINRKIICEEYVPGPLSDFKFYCFEGIPKYFYVSQGLENGPSAGRISFFDMEGNRAPFHRTDHKELEDNNIELPEFFGRMVEISKALSEPFKFARIDFLTNSEGFYFSEVTLSPCTGMMPIEPKEWDLKLGEMIQL